MSKSSSTKVNQNYGADRLILPYINFKKQKEVWNQSPWIIFYMNFEKNIYHIILFTDQISLTDCFYFWIAFTNFLCCPVCDAINFEINLRFLIKPYLCITKKSGQECKYLKNKHNLKIKEKAFSVIFKGLAVVRKCPKPENGPLKFELNFKFMKIS